MKEAALVLADGTVFRGRSVGKAGIRVGEVVFNTAMTGYQEILTDPSYAEQIVTLTYPHIGNTGCNAVDAESTRVHAAGLIVRDVPRRASNWRLEVDLPTYLEQNDVVAVSDIDTRRLTRHLRDRGAMNGCLMAGEALDVDAGLERARAFPGLAGLDLARVVSTPRSYLWEEGTYDLDRRRFAHPAAEFRVVAYDFGIKHNILRLLVDVGCRVEVVPAQTPVAEVRARRPDGVFLSNGPGDPAACAYAIEAIRALLEDRVPLFGICLGHQLLALAAGARTVKMKFGHHGANHPVIELATGRVLISSQNHGFAVDEQSLPANVRVTHRSLFDHSNQGIEFTDRPAFGFQGHPEASPGPHDVRELFARFRASMQAARVEGGRHA
jgi:carbamoyl-phosphate synthase small subunit